MKKNINLNTSTILSIIFLLIIFSTSIYIGNKYQYNNFCKGNSSCIIKLVDETKNYSLCEKIKENKTNKYDGIDNKTNNKFDSKKCFSFFAVKDNQIKLCDYSNNISNCLFNIAIKEKNISVCNKIKNTFKNNQNNEIKNKSKEISNMDIFNKCILKISLLENNYQLCNKSLNKDMCIYSFAYYKSNLSLCNLTGKYQYSCLNKVNELDKLNKK